MSGFLSMVRASVGQRRLEDVVRIEKNDKPLGKGTFGTVYKGRMKGGHKVAVKMIDKAKLRQLKVSSSIVATECEMMRECTGKENFVQLFDIIESDNRFSLILELCDGGNLQDGSMAVEGTVGEKQVRLLMQQMVQSIAYLHSKNICHRDIKPHNYLVVGNIASSSVKVKLGDFGTALRLERGKLLKDQVGTPAFMAPEIHLLPNKSNGYDHKVDVWAVGVCMIFLLANEYPFIDGKGRLLRNRIIQGDVPLWEANAFQNLFQGAQEVLGLVKKRPSKTARELTRLLLAPRRQDRPSAFVALKHDWFTRDIPESSSGFPDVADNLPLLDMKEFEAGFSQIERDMGWAMDALAAVQISSVEEVRDIDPHDDRHVNCVVCFGLAGEFGYSCPQCYHRVCMSCLQRLPSATCPHCRHEAADMAIAHTIAQIARSGSQTNMQFMNAANAFTNVSMHVDVHHPVPLTTEEKMRRNVCQCCSKASSGSDYICPSCTGPICFQCVKGVLLHTPQCPACGDTQRVAATVPQYVAASEAWASAAELGDALRSSFSDVTRRFSSGFFDQSQSQPGGGPSPSTCSTAASAQDVHAIRPSNSNSFTPANNLHACCLCRGQVGMFDHVCGLCNASVCASCIFNRLPKEDLRCPSCNDASRNAQNMALIRSAHQASTSWHNFWGSVTKSLNGEVAPVAPAVTMI